MVPVLPKGELEVLLEAAIDLSKKGRKIQNVLVFFLSILCVIHFQLTFVFRNDSISNHARESTDFFCCCGVFFF